MPSFHVAPRDGTASVAVAVDDSSSLHELTGRAFVTQNHCKGKHSMFCILLHPGSLLFRLCVCYASSSLYPAVGCWITPFCTTSPLSFPGETIE